MDAPLSMTKFGFCRAAHNSRSVEDAEFRSCRAWQQFCHAERSRSIPM